MTTAATRNPPVPFWNRLRAITFYPLRGTALVVLVVLTLGSLLGYLPGIGWFLSLVVYASAYKFAFEILRSTADGETEPPENSVAVGNGVIWKLLALQLVFLFVVAAAFGAGGPLIGLAVMLAIVFMQPGCMMSLAIDGSFGRAIDPTTAFGIAGRIGGPYLAVFGLLFVIQISAATAGDWLAGMMRAPVVIVPCSSKAAYLDRYAEADKGWTDRAEERWPVPFWHMDAAMASLLILLTAVDAGLGGCFFGIPVGKDAAVRAEFGIDPEFDPVGVIALGHRTDDTGNPGSPARRRRKPLEEIVHRGRWSGR